MSTALDLLTSLLGSIQLDGSSEEHVSFLQGLVTTAIPLLSEAVHDASAAERRAIER